MNFYYIAVEEYISNDTVIGYMTLIVETVQLIVLLCSIIPVEQALKNTIQNINHCC